MTKKEYIHDIIYESETKEGKLFDVVLLIMIVISIIIVSLETVKSYEELFGFYFRIIEWVVTVFFTIEYILRIWSVRNKMSYILSFYGIIDLLSLLPSYLSYFIIGSQSLIILRSLRLLRIFRIFKMARFLNQGRLIYSALKMSKEKIFVFLFFLINIVLVMGSLMYLIEGAVNDSFTSIPRSVYWAIVTLTTVGYGDIAPVTPIGQFIASIMMILGYSVIAVPTGIVTNEMIKHRPQQIKPIKDKHCDNCGHYDHALDAKFCKMCGENLYEDEHPQSVKL